jgi:hypothetical protein
MFTPNREMSLSKERDAARVAFEEALRESYRTALQFQHVAVSDISFHFQSIFLGQLNCGYIPQLLCCNLNRRYISILCLSCINTLGSERASCKATVTCSCHKPCPCPMDREGQKRQHNSPETWTKKASSHGKCYVPF